MDCDTTGVEPDIALVKYKLLAGGGMLKIVNRGVPDALRRLGYDAATVTKIIAHIEKFDTIEDVEESSGAGFQPASCESEKHAGKMPAPLIRSGLKPEHLPVFDCAFKPHQGKRSIGYLAHLENDGRRAAVHQRRDFQDRQHAERKHRRPNPRHLRSGMENGLEMRGDLSRRIEAFAAIEHQKDQ